MVFICFYTAEKRQSRKFLSLYCRNPKLLQKDLLVCFSKILNSGSDHLMMLLVYPLLCRQYLHRAFALSVSVCAGVLHTGAVLESRPHQAWS